MSHSTSKKNRKVCYDSDLKDRMCIFHEKLKKHLSDELLYLSEKKDDYENQILQLNIEKERKNKTLFEHVDNRDIRKYFSPLNLNDMETEKKDERQKALTEQMDSYRDKISQIDKKICEIKELIHEIYDMIENGFQDS